MMRFTTLIWAFFFIGVAFPAHASVFINEVAWMGTAASSNAEWIELANTGNAPVDLSGWTLVAEDGAPSITLSGVLGAGSYFLLERTSDETLSSVTADQIYTGALSNESGETLYLKNAMSDVVDTVQGGAGWANIGGDNTTKDTAQRTPGGWITAPGTPRAQNVSDPATSEDTTTKGEVLGANTTATPANGNIVASSGGTGGSVSQKSPYPRATISVFAGEDKRAFSGFPVTFSASAKGLYDESIPYGTYRWNFGDGTAGEGATLEHTYEFPGEYIATLEVFWGTHTEKDRLSVVVSNAEMIVGSVVAGPFGYIELVNHSEREIDLSGWKLSDGARTFVFPPNTTTLAGKKLILPNKNTALLPTERSPLALFYPSNSIAFTEPVQDKMINGGGSVRGASTVKDPAFQGKNTPLRAANLVQTPDLTGASTTKGDVVLWRGGAKEQAAGIGASSLGMSRTTQWVFIILSISLLLLAGYLIYARGRSEVSVADEYAVIEDIIEGEEDLARESDRLRRQ